ncbi:MAG: Mpo1-like protein, partial [Ramlibacter sp.]
MDATTEATGGALPERRVDQLLAHYGESHQNPRNELIHFVAIPLIMLSLLGLMSAIHPWLPYAFVLASLVYYARLSMMFL